MKLLHYIYDLTNSRRIDQPAHGLRTPGEEIALTARPKIKSQSQIFWYGQSIFCLPHRPKISDFFCCIHWLSVVRESASRNMTKLYSIMQTNLCLAEIACHQLVNVNLLHAKQFIKYGILDKYSWMSAIP